VEVDLRGGAGSPKAGDGGEAVAFDGGEFVVR
jgi:hypothetical protein